MQRKNPKINKLSLSAKSYKLKASGGFTLMEIVVATTIFAVVVVAMTTLFNYTLKINRRAEALRQATQGVRDTVELLAKEVRNGQIDYGIVDPGGTTQNTSFPAPCTSPVPGNATYANPSKWLGLLNLDGSEECIYYGDDTLPLPNLATGNTAPAGKNYTIVLKKVGVANAQILNPPNFRVDSLKFIVNPITDPYTPPPTVSSYAAVQPFVTILAKFVVALPTGEQVPVYYQTSVSTENYNVPH